MTSYNRHSKKFKMGLMDSGSEEHETKSLAEANNHLAVNMHRLLAEEKGNVFFSPFCISTAMAMLLCAAEGETESEMRATLGYDLAGIKRDEVTSIFQQQMSLLQNPKSYTLSCANSMITQKGFEVKDRYRQILSETFKALMLEFDFEKENEKAVKHINEWVKEKTNNMIPEILNSLDSNAVIVLLNAVYFKGTWDLKFKEENTDKQAFYNKGIKDNLKQIDMMHLCSYFYFYENETLRALRLPYFGEEVSMLILLPHKVNGLESVEAGLNPSFLGDITKSVRGCAVLVSLPRFRLEYSKGLIPCFQRLGIRRVFDRGAELGVASDSPDLAVSEITHRAVLEVNEEGSEAAAANLSVLIPLSPQIFVADHPFLFVIYDTRNDLILFMGRVDEL